jgi:hypothetical protein
MKHALTRNIQSGKTLTVKFVNNGTGQDCGVHECQLFDMSLTEQQRPAATVCSPFGLQDTKLMAQFVNNQWVCDLD